MHEKCALTHILASWEYFTVSFLHRSVSSLEAEDALLYYPRLLDNWSTMVRGKKCSKSATALHMFPCKLRPLIILTTVLGRRVGNIRVRSVWSSVHVGEPVNMECDDVASMHLCICLVECESCPWNCLPFTAFVTSNLAKYQ